jgi:hypothetical protein
MWAGKQVSLRLFSSGKDVASYMDESRLHGRGRVPSSQLVANLFQECDPQRIDFHGLCKLVYFSF